MGTLRDSPFPSTVKIKVGEDRTKDSHPLHPELFFGRSLSPKRFSPLTPCDAGGTQVFPPEVLWRGFYTPNLKNLLTAWRRSQFLPPPPCGESDSFSLQFLPLPQRRLFRLRQVGKWLLLVWSRLLWIKQQVFFDRLFVLFLSPPPSS